MRNIVFTVAAALLCVLGSAGAQSVYKCTNADGSVSFQDRACPGQTEEQKVRVQRDRPQQRRSDQANFDVKIVELPDIGDAAIAVFDYMEIARSASAGQATQVRVQSMAGASERMNLVMSFRQNSTGAAASRESLERTVRELARPYSRQVVEQLEIIDLNGKFGTGFVTLVENPINTATSGQQPAFSTVVVGQMSDTNVTVTLTLKTNGVDGQAFGDSFDVIKSMVVAPEITGVNQTPGKVSVTQAPDGFSWQQLPEITAAVPRPHGWYFDTAHEGKNLRYHLSRTEDEKGAEGYDAGLTISVSLNLPTSGSRPPAKFAEELVREFSQGQDIIQPPFTGRRGNLVVHGVQVRVEDPDRGFYNAHMVAMANIRTGTVYLCIFQAPSDEWAELWALGQQMISKLAITDSV